MFLIKFFNDILRQKQSIMAEEKLQSVGIVEGKLHSECDTKGCGEKFKVNEIGKTVEVERDEAVLSGDKIENNKSY